MLVLAVGGLEGDAGEVEGLGEGDEGGVFLEAFETFDDDCQDLARLQEEETLGGNLAFAAVALVEVAFCELLLREEMAE